MYPDAIFLGLDLYTIMIFIGILAAIIVFRVFADLKKAPAKVFNFFIIVIGGSILVGFLSATLFQSVYNYIDTGVWKWGGMTFIGGLIGGVLCFFLFYFLIGHFVFRGKEHILSFGGLLNCVIPCVVLAPAFGRIGCLFAGCCYGIPSEKLGISMLIGGVWEKRIATQLIESIFLFLLFGVLAFLLLKKDNRYLAQITLIAYGVFRFAIEFLRGDPRGSSGIPGVSPSQVTSILFVLVGIGLIFFQKYASPKLMEKLQTHENDNKE